MILYSFHMILCRFYIELCKKMENAEKHVWHFFAVFGYFFIFLTPEYEYAYSKKLILLQQEILEARLWAPNSNFHF